MPQMPTTATAPPAMLATTATRTSTSASAHRARTTATAPSTSTRTPASVRQVGSTPTIVPPTLMNARLFHAECTAPVMTVLHFTHATARLDGGATTATRRSMCATTLVRMTATPSLLVNTLGQAPTSVPARRTSRLLAGSIGLWSCLGVEPASTMNTGTRLMPKTASKTQVAPTPAPACAKARFALRSTSACRILVKTVHFAPMAADITHVSVPLGRQATRPSPATTVLSTSTSVEAIRASTDLRAPRLPVGATRAPAARDTATAQDRRAAIVK